ncbi:hypothetical protein [Lacinutrix salivirga]
MLRFKELLWLIGMSLLVMLINGLSFGVDLFTPKSVTNINIHDTYLVIANVHLACVISTLIIFGVYLIRIIVNKFKNLTVSIIFMSATIVLILILTDINSILDSLIQQTSGWTIYPPLSAGEIEPENLPQKNDFSMFSTIINILQLVLLILLAFSGFKTGQHYKKNV